MRRISLAVALIGAVAAAGCGGGAKPSSSDGSKGTVGVNFDVTINNQGPGTVSDDSTPAKTCAADTTCKWTYASGTKVTLTATVTPGNYFNGWFGQCNGGDKCTLSGDAEKYVVAYFSATPDVHPNITDPKLHVSAWAAGVLECTKCHGPELKGQGIAPACNSCHGKDVVSALSPTPLKGHDWPIPLASFVNPTLPFTSPVGHGLASGHNSGQCARCHSGSGFRDLIGADGTASNVTAVSYYPAATGALPLDNTTFSSGIGCDTCHNTATVLGGGALNQHKFPSGNLVTMDGKTAICAQCHDGGRPGYEVATLIGVIGATTADTQMASTQKTQRAHYLPAASTLFGADAANWYQYTGAIYTAKNQHGGKASCVDCHDAHSGNLPFDDQIQAKCGGCHFNETTGLPVANFLELEESRQFGFEGDIDGNGKQESLKVEIDGLGSKLYAGIQAYAVNMNAKKAICVASNRAYEVKDAAAACNTGTNTTEYAYFSPRLLKAVYNYMMYQNDTGAWAHNPRYAVEVLYDTIADLNVALAPLGKQVPNGKRAFNGHFGAAEDASPYAAMIYHGASNAVTGETLPTMGFTSAACYQCHGGKVGFDQYLSNPLGTNITMAGKVTAMECSVCHTWGADMKGLRSDITTVVFPGQKAATGAGRVDLAASSLPTGFAICATCHSGRENGTSIDVKIGLTPPDSWSLSITNPHYLGAAAMILGNDVKPMYQYGTNTYAGKPVFWKTGTSGNAPGPYGSAHGAQCNGCHDAKASKHTFEVDLDYCATCHNISSHGDHRLAPIEEEFQARTAELYAAIRTYAAANIAAIQTATGKANATNICYWNAGVGGGAYYAVELDGVCQNGVSPAGSVSFTKANPTLLKAAFNYLWTQKEPGAWAHNEVYVTQVIYDSIVDLGGTPSFTRP